ncbi:hypothetical protein LE181_23655 [Streptomyces sp. SCA3-4]|uniref:hypothetical protein n=1 Tax=Streptomyces sichuanensis TaxID=2871810 RepID=UPI001CE27730|nr:hypothetical protein [Streptomyces sichuanensis]MCA6095150.1 hypothetical protein [Streptomyces sichuanensis]
MGMWHRRRPERDEFPCLDCGFLTAPLDGPDEWYMVHDSVWQCAGIVEDSVLCVGCLEARLDRRLLHTDFTPVALNDPDYGHHSERLLSRLRPRTQDPGLMEHPHPAHPHEVDRDHCGRLHAETTGRSENEFARTGADRTLEDCEARPRFVRVVFHEVMTYLPGPVAARLEALFPAVR